MSTLGLEALTDDQIVEMVREIAAEMARRNPAVLDASQRAMADAVASAAANQDRKWITRKWLASMIDANIGTDMTVSIWSKGSDVRVYFDKPGNRHEMAQKICYFATGNNRNAPRSVTKEYTKVDDKLVKIIAEEVMKHLKASDKLECKKALNTEYDVPPMPEELLSRIAALETQRAWKNARSSAEAESWLKAMSEANEFEAAERARLKLDKYEHMPFDISTKIDRMRAVAREKIEAELQEWDAANPEPAL